MIIWLLIGIIGSLILGYCTKKRRAITKSDKFLFIVFACFGPIGLIIAFLDWVTDYEL